MKVIECYVENFGCLQQFSYQFQEGLTTINEMNGWGKSTFAVFVRSMFYGMPKSTKRKIDENERVKYTPWNGGRMGGNLVFEVHGKIYKMERFFDKLEKDDTFVLYDNQTNLVTTDFSSNIGEELFGIDLDAYAKSAYISQDAIEIGTNDSINAKLGNLLDSDNDINNFDVAIKNLKEAKKKYKMSGRKGSIAEAEIEIAQKKIQLEKQDNIREALIERTKQIERIREEKENIQKQLETVKEKVGQAAKFEANVQKKKQYDEVVHTLVDKKQEITQTQGFFKKGLPKEQALAGCKQTVTNLEQLKGEQKSYTITEQELQIIKLYEEKISEGFFSNETLHSMDDRNRKYNEIVTKMEDGKFSEEQQQEKKEADLFFKEGTPTEEELRTYTSYISEMQKLETEVAKREAVDKMEAIKNVKSKRAFSPILLIFAIAFSLVGTLLFVFEQEAFAMLAIGIGFVFMGIQFLLNGKKEKKSKEEAIQLARVEVERVKESKELIRKLQELKNKLEKFLQRYNLPKQNESYMEALMQIRDQRTKYIGLVEKEKKANVVELEELQKDNIKQLQVFLITMREEICAEKSDWGKGLQNIREAYNQFISLRKKMKHAEENDEKINDYEERIQKFLEGFQVDAQEDYFAALEKIKSKVEELNRWNQEERKLIETKTKMEETNDFKEWVNLEDNELAIETLRMEERVLEEKREEQKELEKQIQDKMNELLATSDELEEVEQEKIILEEQIEKDEKKLYVIESTVKYLQEAKALFSSHYLKGLRGSFDKYMQRVGDENIAGATLDAKMEVSIDKNGAMRKLDYFSRGNKDLINVCARFALVDALFENEKPFLIMDDTFVNFDEEKLKKILDLLVEISETYQVVYLVCHKSRVSK